MAQLRGAEVTIQAPREMTGVIFGVETRQERVIADGTTTVFTTAILNLVTEDGLRAVVMDDIQQIALTDDDLQAELDKALALILASRDTDHKPVDINFVGEGTRDVRIGYVAEAPVWKTSYRLDLSGEEPRVQAWAIVENTSDTDWTDVHLSLVSGQPVSFIVDLYTPLYIPRPVITPKRASAVVRGGRSPEFIGPRMEMDLSQAGGSGDAWAEDGYDIRDYAPAAAPAEAGLSNMATVASGAAVGELFRFDLPEPVTLDRKTSAMLPLLDTEIEAEKVSIFNAAMGLANPYNGVLLTNSSGMKLPAGPMTVLDGGMYAGDAMLMPLVGDDDQLISYAIDLMVEVDSVDEYTSDLTAVEIVRGVLVMTHKVVFEQTYSVENKADGARMMIIEHPYSPSMTLISPDEAYEQTPNWYRFRLEVAAGESDDLLVATERIQSQRVAVLNCNAATLANYRKNGAFSEDVLDALAAVVAKRQEIGQLSEQLAALRQEVTQLERAQNRLRQNLTTVGNDSDLGREYLRKMAEQETRFDEIDTEVDTLTDAIQQATDALAEYVSNLTVE
jgi:uncharacterized coiled-coil protein SlyX